MREDPEIEKKRDSFLALMLDSSFERFITPRIVTFLYVVAVMLLMFLGVAIGSHPRGSIIVGILVFIFGPIAARLLLELNVVVFKVAEHLEAIDENIRYIAEITTEQKEV